MSIAAMVENEVATAQGEKPPTVAADENVNTPGGKTLTSLAAYVPVEAIAAYTILLPFVDPSGDGWTGHWLLAVGVTGLAVFYTVGYLILANRASAGRPRFRFPWIPVVTTVLALWAWVFTSPDSPFKDLSWYSVELGVAAGPVALTFVAFFGSLAGESKGKPDPPAKKPAAATP